MKLHLQFNTAEMDYELQVLKVVPAPSDQERWKLFRHSTLGLKAGC